MADFGLKEGAVARERSRLHGDDVKCSFGLVLGAVAMIPSYITMVFLVLSKLGAVGNFVGGYKILNAYCFPILDLIAHSADINDMSPLVFIFTGLFPLLFMFSCYVGFRISYNQIDVKEKVVYK
jgi:hypothetical protein